MFRNQTVAVSSILLCLCPSLASAQEIAIGLGMTEFSDAGEHSGTFEFDYRHRPFLTRRVVSVAWGTTFSATAEKDLFVGTGVSARWLWKDNVFLEASVMPGFYKEGTAANDLGSSFEIRSLLAAGYLFENGNAISVAVIHKSNAGVANYNPGANSFVMRYHIAF